MMLYSVRRKKKPRCAELLMWVKYLDSDLIVAHNTQDMQQGSE